MKRTSLMLDEKLLEEATRLAVGRTYSATVNQALQDFVRRARAPYPGARRLGSLGGCAGGHAGRQAAINPGKETPVILVDTSRKSRVLVIVSRQLVVDSKFSSVTCAPVYSSYDGLSTQVLVGTSEGLKHESSIHCDELISIGKSALTDFIGRLSADRTADLDKALAIALGIR